MIYQLDKNDYERTRPLFEGLEYNLVVPAVIEGANPGRIYADDAYHLAETGLVYFMAGRYTEAARCYEQAFALHANPFPHQYYHLAARAWAAQGERDMAYKYLHMAIDHGENRSEHTRNCKEFVCLHSEQEWQDLLARLKEKTNGDAQGRNH
jgi:tetratricopeptide (TPR) repeat protein